MSVCVCVLQYNTMLNPLKHHIRSLATSRLGRTTDKMESLKVVLRDTSSMHFFLSPRTFLTATVRGGKKTPTPFQQITFSPLVLLLELCQDTLSIRTWCTNKPRRTQPPFQTAT